MKKPLLLIIFIIFLSSIISGQNNKWRQYANTKDINALVEKGNTVWVGTSSGLAAIETSTNQVSYYNTLTSGLSNNNITCLASDNENVLWIGSTDSYCDSTGLIMYDGNTWIHYTTENSGLCNNDIRSLYQDNDGNLWIGTNHGLSKRTSNGSWVSYTSGGVPYDPITCLDMDNSGNLWMGTEGSGIYKFDGTNWTMWAEYNSEIPSDEITDIEVAGNGHVWIATQYGIAEFDGSGFITYNYYNSNLTCNGVFSLDFDTNGTLWVATECGIYKYDGSTWVKYDESNSGLPDGSARAILAGAGNIIWTGISKRYCEGGSSLASFNGSDWLISDISQTPIYCNYINSVALRDSSVIWAGGYNNLMRFDGQNWTNYNVYNSLLPGSVSSLAIDSSDKVWIGTNGGLARFDGTYWQIFTETNSGLSDNIVTKLEFDHTGILWIGTEHGLNKFDGTNFTLFDPNNSGLPNLWITALCADQQNNLWIASKSGNRSLSKFDGITWTSWDEDNSSFPDAEITDIESDNYGNIWMTTPFGLIKFDGTDFITYTDSTQLWENYFTSLEIDTEGNFWMGNYGEGLVKYDGSSWTYFNEDTSPIVGSVLLAVALAPNGTKWIGTPEGLSAYNENGLFVRTKNINPPALTFTISPNPVSSFLTINNHVNEKIVNIDIINLNGTVVKTCHNETNIDVRFLPAGIYCIRANTSKALYTCKFIKF